MSLLDETERTVFTTWYRTILDDDDLFAFRPCLIHGDLSPEHVVYDEITRKT